MLLNVFYQMVFYIWDNVVFCYVNLFNDLFEGMLKLFYIIFDFDFSYFFCMIMEFGMWQFVMVSILDCSFGYMLDDNVCVFIVVVDFFGQIGEYEVLRFVGIYLDFIECVQ